MKYKQAETITEQEKQLKETALSWLAEQLNLTDYWKNIIFFEKAEEGDQVLFEYPKELNGMVDITKPGIAYIRQGLPIQQTWKAILHEAAHLYINIYHPLERINDYLNPMQKVMKHFRKRMKNPNEDVNQLEKDWRAFQKRYKKLKEKINEYIALQKIIQKGEERTAEIFETTSNINADILEHLYRRHVEIDGIMLYLDKKGALENAS